MSSGLWATKKGCAAFGITNPGGAIAGNGIQIAYQIVGALFIIGWNIVWTSLIMIFIKYVCRVPLRMSPEQLEEGDFAIHGEEPYTFEYFNRNYRRINVGYTHDHPRDEEHNGDSGSDPRHEGVLMGKDPHLGPAEAKDEIKKQD